ncbi:HD domain-containing protein [Vreelandella rituensis]|uniref:HD domain-containing protein n=1 Tax=Vreelandella rituensis TaxID=2282306 RepID=A0A368U9L0_9GAMM|nr:HD domain-containing protein [Halomonas rituensis]RCV93909.1 HD domain-containing protein [Halomonas rituensis]
MFVQLNAKTEHRPELANTLVTQALALVGTQVELASRLGMSPKALREISNGDTRMRYPVQHALESIIAQRSNHQRCIVEHARIYACAAHDAIGHHHPMGMPYREHLRLVVDVASEQLEHVEHMAAAWLHDILEHTQHNLSMLKESFPDDMAVLVDSLTKPTKHAWEQPNDYSARVARRLANAPAPAQTIKLADLLCNLDHLNKTDTIPDRPSALIYVQHKLQVADQLAQGAPLLRERCLRTGSELLERINR